MPTQLSASGLKREVDEQIAATLQFSGGKLAVVHASLLANLKNEVNIYGSNGRLEIGKNAPKTREKEN